MWLVHVSWIASEWRIEELRFMRVAIHVFQDVKGHIGVILQPDEAIHRVCHKNLFRHL